MTLLPGMLFGAPETLHAELRDQARTPAMAQLETDLGG